LSATSADTPKAEAVANTAAATAVTRNLFMIFDPVFGLTMLDCIATPEPSKD
jgi:hypothetical protein